MIDDTLPTSPTQQRNQALPVEPPLPDPAATEKRLFMTQAIGSRGFLRQFVPMQPPWCRTVGDQIESALRRRDHVHPCDMERVAYVFRKAQGRRNARIMKRNPSPGTALLFRRVQDEHGIEHWVVQDVPFAKALITATEGCA